MSNQVPEGWKLSKIAEISSILDSKRVPLNSQERAKRVGEYPYYGANGVQGYIDDFIFEGEHVLLAEDGGNFEQWATRPISYLVDGKFWVNNHAHILKAKKNHSTKFIHYSLVHKNILKHINGGTRAKLNQADMRDIQVLCPPFPEQQKIAKILTSVDEVIEKTQAQIDKLKDLKTGMMQELLTQGVGVDGKPHTEFKDSPVGRIPKAWEVKCLGEIFPKIVVGYVGNVNDYYCDSGEGVPFYRTLNIRDGYIRHEPIKYVTRAFNDKNKKSQISNDDILIARVGANLGMTCKVTGLSTPANIANAIIIKAKKGISSGFFSEFIRSQLGQAQIQLGAAGGAQGVFNTGLAQGLIVPVPSNEEQKNIEAVLKSIDEKINKVQLYLERKVNLKKGLMQDLLTGKVRVAID